MVGEKQLGSRIFRLGNHLLLVLIALTMVLPFIHVIAASFTTSAELADKRFVLFPTVFSLDAYKYIFSTNTIFKALFVSIGVTLIGTLWSMFISLLTAYGLSRKDLIGRRQILFLFVFTMLFSGGMIPTFLIVKNTGLLDSYAALIVPVTINVFNMIILRSFIMGLPEGLIESAKIDGCNDFGVLFRIVMPISKPALATVSLFYAVAYWNTYMHAILYINDAAKWPIQVLLRQIVVLASGLSYDSSEFTNIPPPDITIKMAVIVVATIPVLMVYPFLQKYFTKGAMLGSMKE
ncbi:carbohydrate ABC transporter permease [Fredinandcohnia sp. QZ13]|uniref:carbohydrate ABC transporter permease n=1 Tax=Fredinandcohnia sp. QZ13 TaxID=3073144 RepID=UPI0028532EC6|nr:carbohydrate ABC transporter permease [Fredinandcohnia sp. QZ13]MDR4887187.1 carbohydrate ABC transporter permease [Fredinandcohnia sp. QZ13]